MKLIFKKTLPIFLVLALLVGVIAVNASAASRDGALAGTYSAVVEKNAMGNPITYTCKMTFNADGSYNYSVHILIPANPDSPAFEDGYDDTEVVTGSFAVTGNDIAFSGSDSFDTGVIVDEHTVSVHGYISSFAAMSGMEDIVLTKNETHADSLKAGRYYLGVEDYPPEAMMKIPAIITIDTAEKTFNTQDAREGNDLAPKGFGHYEFDSATGVYTVTYTQDTQATSTTFTFANDAITFTTPMGFGMAVINVLDENGNFIPYSAHLMDDEQPPVTDAPVQPTAAPTGAPAQPTAAPSAAPGAPATGAAGVALAGAALVFAGFAAAAGRRKENDR